MAAAPSTTRHHCRGSSVLFTIDVVNTACKESVTDEESIQDGKVQSLEGRQKDAMFLQCVACISPLL